MYSNNINIDNDDNNQKMRDKYYKYKSKYLNLSNTMKGGGLTMVSEPNSEEAEFQPYVEPPHATQVARFLRYGENYSFKRLCEIILLNNKNFCEIKLLY